MSERATSNKEVTIYEHGNFQGRSQKLVPGKYNIHDLSIGNDSLSSLKIPEGIRVTLYEHADFMGNEKKFDADTPWVGDDFNDKTSSILVELMSTGGTVPENIEQDTKVEEQDTIIGDCAKFSISFYEVFEGSGTISRSGRLSLRVSCLNGIYREFAVDISEKEYCDTLSYAIEGARYCFYLKDSCLWFRLCMEGLFHKKLVFNEKVVDIFNKGATLTVDIYKKLKENNCTADEVVKFMKDFIPGVTNDVLAETLKGAGYGLNEIGNALQKAGYVPNEIASALRKAGYNAKETAKCMKDNIPGVTAEVLAAALKNAGYGLNEITTVLKELYGFGAEALKKVLEGAGYAGEEIGNFFKNMGGEFADLFKKISTPNIPKPSLKKPPWKW